MGQNIQHQKESSVKTPVFDVQVHHRISRCHPEGVEEEIHLRRRVHQAAHPAPQEEGEAFKLQREPEEGGDPPPYH